MIGTFSVSLFSVNTHSPPSVRLEVQHPRPFLRTWSVAERAEEGAGAWLRVIQQYKKQKGRPPSPKD